jgi:hypothetical protein
MPSTLLEPASCTRASRVGVNGAEGIIEAILDAVLRIENDQAGFFPPATAACITATSGTIVRL